MRVGGNVCHFPINFSYPRSMWFLWILESDFSRPYIDRPAWHMFSIQICTHTISCHMRWLFIYWKVWYKSSMIINCCMYGSGWYGTLLKIFMYQQKCTKLLRRWKKKRPSLNVYIIRMFKNVYTCEQNFFTFSFSGYLLRTKIFPHFS